MAHLDGSVEPSLSNLAILGGSPSFESVLHVGRPNIGDATVFKDRVDDILERRWFTNSGYYVKEFERRVANFVGAKHCIAMCNATVALEIAFRALELKGDVIVPSFTFVATAHALQWQEITPVFCDVDPATFNLDPQKVEDMITPRTSGIIGVHVYGRPAPIEALSDIAARRGLRLLFDSAHAFGCSYNGQMIGGFGDAEVFSFHATKFLNSLEGGAVVTNSDELAKRIRLMKNFGFTNYDQTDYIGVNGKMNEVSAAMGLTNLESLEAFVEVNKCNYRQYNRELFGLEGVELIMYDDRDACNYQYVVLEIDKSKTHVSRDQVMEILHAENVLARRYFYPGCHRLEPYRSFFPHAGLLLPHTERLVNRVLCLPTGTGVSEADIDRICAIVRIIVENGAELKRRLNASSRVDGQLAWV